MTKKWQGYPPQNLNVLGKPLPPLSYIALPRYTGKAEYATRVMGVLIVSAFNHVEQLRKRGKLASAITKII